MDESMSGVWGTEKTGVGKRRGVRVGAWQRRH